MSLGQQELAQRFLRLCLVTLSAGPCIGAVAHLNSYDMSGRITCWLDYKDVGAQLGAVTRSLWQSLVRQQVVGA